MIELVLELLSGVVRDLFDVRSHLRVKQMAHEFLIGHLMRFLF
jgi:hypothetical protein